MKINYWSWKAGCSVLVEGPGSVPSTHVTRLTTACNSCSGKSLYKKNARTNFSLIFTFQTGETRTISHFHYTTWPDFGVPESPASFLNFLFKVRESGCLTPDHGPAVIHCSAGIGRSGTFSLVDTCLVLVSVMRSHWCFVLLCFVLSFYNVDDKKINNFA